MSAKSKKIELNEEFIALWREEQRFWDAMSPLYRDKNEKGKSLERMSGKFHCFFRLIFLNKVLFQMQNIFSTYPANFYMLLN